MRAPSRVLFVAIAVCACGKPAASPRAPTSCPDGAFAREVARVMPPLLSAESRELGEPGTLARAKEPGCMVPFRDEDADDKARDVGRVVVSLRARDAAPTVLGRGRLYIGKGTMTLVVKDDAGEETLLVAVEGRKVLVRRKGEPTLRTTIALGPGAALPLPIDALVAALEGCEADVRLGATDDALIVSARRGAYALVRTRYLDPESPSAVDTSTLCGRDDAIVAWRSSAGEIGWSLTVASARAPVSMRIEQLVRKHTDADPAEPKPEVNMDGD